MLTHNENALGLESTKLAANLQLTPTRKEQAKALLDTPERSNGGRQASFEETQG
jgi:hypothetical protein